MKAESARVVLKRMRAQSAGDVVSESDLREDIAAGVPVDARGRIDPAAYMAWMLRRHGYPGHEKKGGA